MVCPKSCFLLISSYVDVIKSPADVKFSEVLSPLKFVDEFRDERKGVLALHCNCIQHLVAQVEVSHPSSQ